MFGLHDPLYTDEAGTNDERIRLLLVQIVDLVESFEKSHDILVSDSSKEPNLI